MTGIAVLAARDGPALRPPGPAPARSWRIFARAGHPMLRPLCAATGADHGPPGTAVLLGAGPPENELLLAGVRRAAARGGRLVLLHGGAGGLSLVRAACAENRALTGVSIELPALPTAAAIETALAVTLGDAAFPPGGPRTAPVEVRVEADGRMRGTVWEPVGLPAAPEELTGSVVVTGGLGGLGIRAAALLACRYRLHPVLIDARTPAGIGTGARRWLSRLPGATVRTADVTDPAALAAALSGLPAPPAVLLHCAGVLSAGRLAAYRPRDLAAAQAVKAGGLRHVLAALDRPPGRVVVFGSALAETTPHGLAGYALANETLRRTAARLARPGTSTVIAQWWMWAGAGMAHDLGVVPQARRMGRPAIPLAAGLRLLPALLGRFPAPVTMLRIGGPA